MGEEEKKKTEREFWDKHIEKLGVKLKIWDARTLSLEGKVYIIKSIGIAQLLCNTYAILRYCAIPNLDMKSIRDNHKKIINDLLWSFLWYSKSPKFSKIICKLPHEKGGSGLINIDVLVKVK